MKLFDSFKRKERKAFTLVELLVVVAIIGILFIVLMASVNWSTDTARESGVQTDLRAYQTAANAVGLEAAGFPDDVKTLSTMLNKRLDPNMEVSVLDNKLVTAKEDPWGTAYQIDYNRPANSKGQLVFTSAGPNTVFGDADDIITVIRYEIGADNGSNIVIENPKNDEFHTHTYTRESVDAKYLYKAATCTKAAQYYYSCECGAMGTTMFENGLVDKTKHSDVDNEYRTVDLSTHRFISRCKDCSEIIKESTEAHKEEWVNGTSKCSLCKQVLHTHVYNQQIATNDYLKIAPTCLANAVYYYSCECGVSGSATFEYGSPIPHDFSAQTVNDVYLKSYATCMSEAVYYKSCIYCGTAGTETFNAGAYNTSNHIGETNVSYVAMDKDYHMKHYTCSQCNNAVRDSQKELHSNDAATGQCVLCNSHTHAYVQMNAVARYLKTGATCTTKAVYYYNCICGEASKTDTFEYGQPLEHDFSNKSVQLKYRKTSANCTSPAVYYYSCSCGLANPDAEFVYGEIDLTVHANPNNFTIDYVFENVDEHKIVKVCTDCNEQMGTPTFGAHAYVNGTCTQCNNHSHVFDALVADEQYLRYPATCTTPATYYKSCTTCGQAGTATFTYGVIAEHDYTAKITTSEYINTNANCKGPASYFYSCSYCGDKGKSVFTYGNANASVHAQTSPSKTSSASVCTTYECCGLKDETHQLEYEIFKEATCSSKGITRYYCIDCNYEYELTNIPMLEHTYGPPATCTTDQICTMCKIVLNGATGHTPGSAATCTASQVCTACLSIITPASGHDYSGPAATCTTPQTCKTCNAVLNNKLGHDYTGTPATCTTAQTCSRAGCGTVLREAYGHSPGIAANCTENQLCTTCLEVLVAALGHLPGNKPTCTTDQTCTRFGCGYILEYRTGHNIVNINKINATCHEPGYTAGYYCTNIDPNTGIQCGYKSDPVELDALGCNWSGNVPTCTEPQRCTRCSTACTNAFHEYGSNILLPALGHNMEPATCILPSTCSRCGKTEGSATGHSWVEATCTEAKRCITCGTKNGNALGHQWSHATCTDMQYCQRENCSATQGAALGHSWVEDAYVAPTCTETGLSLGRHCNRHDYNTGLTCTAREEQEVLPATGHAWTDWVTTKYPTCIAEGQRQHQCNTCELIVTEPIDKIAHTYDYVYNWSCKDSNHKYNNAVTCIATATCSYCSHSFSETQNCTQITTQIETCYDQGKWYHHVTWNNEHFTKTNCMDDEVPHNSGASRKLHNLSTPAWTWKADSDGDRCEEVNLTITCSNCVYNVSVDFYYDNGDIDLITDVEPTCSTAGSGHYYVEYYDQFVGLIASTCTCGVPHQLNSPGHLYNTPTLTWDETNGTCVATVSCNRSTCDYIQKIQAIVSPNNAVSAATCTEMSREQHVITGWPTASDGVGINLNVQNLLQQFVGNACCKNGHTVAAALGHDYTNAKGVGGCDTYKIRVTCSRCSETTDISPEYTTQTTAGSCDVQADLRHNYKWVINGKTLYRYQTNYFKMGNHQYTVAGSAVLATCTGNHKGDYVHSVSGGAISHYAYEDGHALVATHHEAFYKCNGCGGSVGLPDKHLAYFPEKWYTDSPAWYEAAGNLVWLFVYETFGNGASEANNELNYGHQCWECSQKHVLPQNIEYPLTPIAGALEWLKAKFGIG